jgi:type I restriction enzyme S subunit
MLAGGVRESGIMYVPNAAAPAIKNYRIRHNDIFISVAGTLGVVGRVPKSLDDANLTENADRITGIKCDVDYLMYYLLGASIQNEIDAIRTVGAQPKLALGRIKTFEVLLPRSRDEQAAVSGALRDVDRLIDSLNRLIAKRRSIKQGMMQELLTGRTRLPGFIGDWLTLHVAASSHLKARIGWQGLTAGEYRASGKYRLVGGTDFRDGCVDWTTTPYVDKWRFDQDRNIQLKEGDVLITKDGTIGKVAFVDTLPGPVALNSGVFVVRPKGEAYDSGFLYHMLRSRFFDDFVAGLSAGSTINHLYQRDLVKLKLLVPPTLDEQKAIADALFDADGEITALVRRLEGTRAIKQGMMQELLTGRTRLVSEGGTA